MNTNVSSSDAQTVNEPVHEILVIVSLKTWVFSYLVEQEA